VKNNLTLSQAIEGCLLYKTAAGQSPHTISDYRNSYKKLLLYVDGKVHFASISRDQLLSFFAWLQDEYISEPDGIAPRGKIRLSPKSVANIHTALSALWTWGVNEGYVDANIVRSIEPPRYERPAIEPLTREEIRALVAACDHTRTWKSRATVSKRPTADRDKAIVLLLVDTGIRRSELCDAKISDLNLQASTLHVAGKGRGRDKKERIVHFGKRTTKALWRYLTPRLSECDPDDPLFLAGSADDPRPIEPGHLRRLLKRLGERAGVHNVYPHRFRHTFAITYLRNGGDPFTLRILLGHSDLEMVERYLAIVRADCSDAHRRASPVDNWRL
jgi:integrase/recombinase XerD